VYVLGAVALTAGSSGEKRDRDEHGPVRFLEPLLNRRVLQLVPAWLSMNVIVGLWLSPVFPFLLTADDNRNQFLAGLFIDQPQRVGLVMLVYAIVFAAGVLCWSFALDRYPRRRIMMISLTAMLLVCGGLYAVNHSATWPAALRWLVLCFVAGCVMVESVFTPAALALLADIVGDRSGRGTIMAFYSVLLSAGALAGAVIGGFAGRVWAVDGLIYATFALALISMITVRTIPEPTA
jgi:MFS family permease